MDTNTLMNDFRWVIKILDSSINEDHMGATLKCFNLWESKYSRKDLSSKDKKVIDELRHRFWVKYNTKFDENL